MTENEPTDVSHEIDSLRQEIDTIDLSIIDLICRRTGVSQRIGQIRSDSGGPNVIPEREDKIRERYSGFGEIGIKLANSLLELGRGQLDDNAYTPTVKELMEQFKSKKLTLEQTVSKIGSSARIRQDRKFHYDSIEPATDDDVEWIELAFYQHDVTEDELSRLFAALEKSYDS